MSHIRSASVLAAGFMRDADSRSVYRDANAGAIYGNNAAGHGNHPAGR